MGSFQVVFISGSQIEDVHITAQRSGWERVNEVELQELKMLRYGME
jgi:hypothetical protein